MTDHLTDRQTGPLSGTYNAQIKQKYFLHIILKLKFVDNFYPNKYVLLKLQNFNLPLKYLMHNAKLLSNIKVALQAKD